MKKILGTLGIVVLLLFASVGVANAAGNKPGPHRGHQAEEQVVMQCPWTDGPTVWSADPVSNNYMIHLYENFGCTLVSRG
jgi:hypothetical protein